MFGAGRLARGFTDIMVGNQTRRASLSQTVCLFLESSSLEQMVLIRTAPLQPSVRMATVFIYVRHGLVCALRNLISVAVAVNPVSNIGCGQMIDSLLLPFMSFSFYACSGSRRKQVVGGCGSPFTS